MDPLSIACGVWSHLQMWSYRELTTPSSLANMQVKTRGSCFAKFKRLQAFSKVYLPLTVNWPQQPCNHTYPRHKFFPASTPYRTSATSLRNLTRKRMVYRFSKKAKRTLRYSNKCCAPLSVHARKVQCALAVFQRDLARSIKDSYAGR